MQSVIIVIIIYWTIISYTVIVQVKYNNAYNLCIAFVYRIMCYQFTCNFPV